MKINQIKSKYRSTYKKPRKGRGIGGGSGAKSGRGQKGQRSRSGGRRGSRPGFEGGMKAFVRRMPKLRGQSKGAMKVMKKLSDSVSVTILDKYFDAKELITIAKLKKKNIIARDVNAVKVVAGKSKKTFTFDKEIKLSASLLGTKKESKK